MSENRGRMVLISVDGLRVRFSDRWALDGLSFCVAGGEVVGLLGPNGAGKTTTLSVLATLQRADAGVVIVAGHDTASATARVRRLLGFVPQSLSVYPTLTAWENVLFFARLYGLRGAAVHNAAARVLAVVGLEERRHEIVSTFSGGMQRRLNLACGLLHTPRVLLLDEPTVGVDPQSRERIFLAVRAQAEAGAAVVYSTHYMEEAERLCDRVVLIDHGQVVAAGTPAELVSALGRGLRLDVTTHADLPAGWHEGIAGVSPLVQRSSAGGPGSGKRVQVMVDDLTVAPRALERAAALAGEVLEFHIHQPDLQDVFLKLTGHELRD